MTAEKVQEEFKNGTLTRNTLKNYYQDQVTTNWLQLNRQDAETLLFLSYKLFESYYYNIPNGSALEAFKQNDLRKFMRHADPSTLRVLKPLEIYYFIVASIYV